MSDPISPAQAQTQAPAPAAESPADPVAQWPSILVVMALPIEAQELFEHGGVPVLYTGLGKVNAAMALMRRLCAYRAAGAALPLVINFGTAGSHHFATGAMVGCHRFVQRDMDVSALGFALGRTPFEDLPAQLQFPPLFGELPEGLCGSGDSFQTGAARLHCEVIDMEAYALAKVCHVEQARFGCAKYITDGADHAAAGDWQNNLPSAAAGFWRLYRQLAAPAG
ncbi:MAG TPA: 5'-nucleosidase [Steroidobacteraceae bacterium]|jgi:adenosylhomocysteine nucleosidase|nr:5'-nucleosidase [Steroidobacteraceae bacterium]